MDPQQSHLAIETQPSRCLRPIFGTWAGNGKGKRPGGEGGAARRHYATSARQTWLAVLEREHSNLRIVLERTSRDGAQDRASRLASALFWFHQGHWREGRTFLSAANFALASNGVVLLALERYDEARAALEESVARGREGRDAWAVALPLRNLAIIAYRQQDYRTARTLLEESLHGLRAVGESGFSPAAGRRSQR